MSGSSDLNVPSITFLGPAEGERFVMAAPEWLAYFTTAKSNIRILILFLMIPVVLCAEFMLAIHYGLVRLIYIPDHPGFATKQGLQLRCASASIYV